MARLGDEGLTQNSWACPFKKQKKPRRKCRLPPKLQVQFGFQIEGVDLDTGELVLFAPSIQLEVLQRMKDAMSVVKDCTQIRNSNVRTMDGNLDKAIGKVTRRLNNPFFSTKAQSPAAPQAPFATEDQFAEHPFEDGVEATIGQDNDEEGNDSGIELQLLTDPWHFDPDDPAQQVRTLDDSFSYLSGSQHCTLKEQCMQAGTPGPGLDDTSGRLPAKAWRHFSQQSQASSASGGTATTMPTSSLQNRSFTGLSSLSGVSEASVTCGRVTIPRADDAAQPRSFTDGTNSTNSELFRSAAAPPQAGRLLSHDSQSSSASDVDQTFTYGIKSDSIRSAAAPPQAGRQLSYDSQSSIASDVDQTPAFTYGIKSDLVRSAAAPPQAGRQLSYDSQSSIASDVDQTPAFTYGIKSDLVRSAAAPPQAGRLLSHDSQSSSASDVDQTFTYGIKSSRFSVKLRQRCRSNYIFHLRNQIRLESVCCYSSSSRHTL
eukprot:TRINITY_DN13186_c0_g1_i12.p1 TRINITY_DN13186_c0_g1~~TRINITY_DN13186_c0_g1_i12.p1  ORF type:complete len:486 (+),score=53.19 TRINITY_DN13186_c0_g1_i12:106-1563(+)